MADVENPPVEWEEACGVVEEIRKMHQELRLGRGVQGMINELSSPDRPFLGTPSFFPFCTWGL